MSVIITGHVYRDAYCHQKVPTPLGPFENREDASLFMASLSPLWGSWNVEPLASPASIHKQQEADRG